MTVNSTLTPECLTPIGPENTNAWGGGGREKLSLSKATRLKYNQAICTTIDIDESGAKLLTDTYYRAIHGLPGFVHRFLHGRPSIERALFMLAPEMYPMFNTPSHDSKTLFTINFPHFDSKQFLSDCERVSTNYALKQLKHSKNGLVFLAWYIHPETLPAKFRSGLSPKEVFKNTREELMHEARKVCQGKDNDMFNYYRYGPEVMHIQRRSSFSKLPRTNSQSSIFDLESKSESVYLASLFDLDKDREQSLLYLKALRDNILSTLETVYGVTSEDKIKIYFHALYAERTTTLHAHIRVNQADHPLEDAKSFGINEIISTLEKGGSVTEMILRRGTIYYTQFSLDKEIEGVCIKIIPNFKRDWYDIFDSLGASNTMTTYLLQAIKYNEVKNRIQLLDIDQIEKLLRIIKINKTFPEIENLVNILKTLEPNRELRKLGWSMETGTCSDLVMNVTVNPNKHFMSENGNGKLRLYHLFPRNYALMADVIADLDRIGQLGFNAIWISPLSASSDLIINRFNIMTAEDEPVKGSLYAATDFSRLNHDMFPDLVDDSLAQDIPASGNPRYSSPHEQAMLQLFTSTAKKNGLTPLFDLVLNHVGTDSDLITGKSPYFVEKGIRTEKWFHEKSERWNDVCFFNYSDPVIRKEIIKELWIPYITKYINDFGFDGVRVDFAGGRFEVRVVEKILFQEIQRLTALRGVRAIIYAELLPPAKKLEENATALRGMYTHVTNCNLWDIESTEHERGMKQQITHVMPGGELRYLPGGTIGFAGSHDDNPNARNALKAAAMQSINNDEFKGHIFYEADKRKQMDELARAITEQVQLTHSSESKLNEFLLAQRQRLVSTALTSDGGWCLFGGDEFGKQMPASVFVTQDGKPMYNDAHFFNEARSQSKWSHTKLIQEINAAMAEMPRSLFPHWAKILNLSCYEKSLVIVMNFNGEGFSDPQPVLTIVNVSDKPIQIVDALIEQIAAEFKSTQGNNWEAFESVLRAKKQLIGNFDSQLEKYKVNVYYRPETREVDSMATNREVMLWDIDCQRALKAEISLSIAQLHELSIFKAKIRSQEQEKENKMSLEDDIYDIGEYNEKLLKYDDVGGSGMSR